MKAIYKAVLRDIYFHKGRSFITFFALFLVIAFPIAMFSTSPSIENSIETNYEEYHLAQLDLFLGPVHEDLTDNISDTILDTIGTSPERIQARLNTNTKLNHEDTWYSVHTLGVDPNKSYDINEVEVIEGHFAMKEGEIAILDTFASHLNVSLGDSLTFNLNEKNATFSIVGLVKAINYLSYELIQEGAVYLNEADLRDLMGYPENYYNEVVIYFSENTTDDEIEESSIDVRDFLEDNHIPVYLVWHTRVVSYSAVLSDALDLTSSYLATSAILIIIIVGIVIFIITKRYAIEQRKQTGMLYSYGFSSKTIMLAFLLRTFVLSIFAIIVGSIVGWYLLKLLSSFLGDLWGLMDVTAILTAGVLIEVIVSTFVVSLLFTFLAARENVSLTPYEAIRGKAKEFSQKLNFSSMLRFPMQLKVPMRNVSRSKMRSILTVIAFSGSIMLSFSLINTQTCLSATQEDYFSKLTWDVQSVFNTPDYSDSIYEELKENEAIVTSEPFLKLNVQFFEQVEQMTNLRGFLSNSTLNEIDLQEGTGFSEDIKNEVILSQYSADNLGYTVGDNCSFWLFDRQINVTIVGLSRTMDMPIAMYIQLETLEDIFGFMPINGMLVDVQDDELDDYMDDLNENPDVQFAIKKAKFVVQIRQVIASQTVIVNIMVVLGLIVSFLSIFSTTLIIVIEREREYALQRVFGFSTWQILTQIFLELMFLVVIALGLGYLSGNYLSIYWKNLVARNFFSVDTYFIWTDYVLLFIFALGGSLFSLFPEYRSLQSQCLADGIKEE
ncbi:ABC transporter permease [Candidatus Lokiarchaeum ossiferum]|uniref:ABC transporter permease n=1 Tax=Candidatus Lokiarchaeum ossiferum TaxID=2951803 RepID=UPI00352D3178